MKYMLVLLLLALTACETPAPCVKAGDEWTDPFTGVVTKNDPDFKQISFGEHLYIVKKSNGFFVHAEHCPALHFCY